MKATEAKLLEFLKKSGHHCAQPLMERLGLAGTTRASLGVCNDERDIDALAAALEAGREMFAR